VIEDGAPRSGGTLLTNHMVNESRHEPVHGLDKMSVVAQPLVRTTSLCIYDI